MVRTGTQRIAKQTGTEAYFASVTVTVDDVAPGEGAEVVFRSDHARGWRMAIERGVEVGLSEAAERGFVHRPCRVEVIAFRGQVADTTDELAEVCTRLAVLRALLPENRLPTPRRGKDRKWRLEWPNG